MRDCAQSMVLKIQEVFCLHDHLSLIVGTVQSPPLRINAVTVTVFLCQEEMGTIHLTGERMPGSDCLPGQRIVETVDDFDWNTERVQAGDYELHW